MKKHSQPLHSVAEYTHINCATIILKQLDDAGPITLAGDNPVHGGVTSVESLGLGGALLGDGVDPSDSSAKRFRSILAHLNI